MTGLFMTTCPPASGAQRRCRAISWLRPFAAGAIWPEAAPWQRRLRTFSPRPPKSQRPRLESKPTSPAFPFLTMFAYVVRSLPHTAAESNVFRVAALFIVLAITGNPTVPLLCGTWCDPNAAAASGCHHEELAIFAIVAGEDGCRNAVLSATAFVQEDVRRGVSSSNGEHAISLSRYELTGSMVDATLGFEPSRQPSLEKRPLETTLRI